MSVDCAGRAIDCAGTDLAQDYLVRARQLRDCYGTEVARTWPCGLRLTVDVDRPSGEWYNAQFVMPFHRQHAWALKAMAYISKHDITADAILGALMDIATPLGAIKYWSNDLADVDAPQTSFANDGGLRPRVTEN